jgi:hypothetical protein
VPRSCDRRAEPDVDAVLAVQLREEPTDHGTGRAGAKCIGRVRPFPAEETCQAAATESLSRAGQVWSALFSSMLRGH